MDAGLSGALVVGGGPLIQSPATETSVPSGAKAPDSIGSATYGLKPVPFKPT